MSKHEKIGSDGYSKELFEAKLSELDALGIPYQPPSTERNTDEEWKMFHDEASDEAKKVVDTLDRLSANAQRMAEKDDLHREYLELLPKIEEAREEIRRTLDDVSDAAPSSMIREVDDVLHMGEELTGVLKSKSPVPGRSSVQEHVGGFIEAKTFVVEKLRKLLGAQNRFGGPLQPL